MTEFSPRIGARSCDQSAGSRGLVGFLRAHFVQAMEGEERFHTVYLDETQGFLGDAPIGEGSAGSLSVRIRDVIGHAITLDARKIIVAHNHPSGECRPSQIDIDATARLKSVASAMDIELLDHLIFTEEAVYSMRAGGKL